MLTFTNRTEELALLDRVSSGLIVLYGRRRIGKTRLITKWCEAKGGYYSQAIEGTTQQQINQIYNDLSSIVGQTSFALSNWSQLFELLDRVEEDLVVCFDEFPYLVAADSSLPSQFQRWIDHSSKQNKLVVLSGSSTRMMYSSVLSESSPLFGRAHAILNITPMGYDDFCNCLQLDPFHRESFVLFSLVGGIPKYWELIASTKSMIEAVDELFFSFSSFMENEPRRLLRDEKIEGINALAVLEAVGRGAHKPSDIASRLGLRQTSLSKVFQLLIKTSLLRRDTPFGSSVRSSKQVLYYIEDPSLMFWFSVYSPHRSRWRGYTENQKELLLFEHASKVLEVLYRCYYDDSGRYWESDFEFDALRLSHHNKKHLILTEVKWKKLNDVQKKILQERLEYNYNRSKLAKQYSLDRIEVVSFEDYVGLLTN